MGAKNTFLRIQNLSILVSFPFSILNMIVQIAITRSSGLQSKNPKTFYLRNNVPIRKFGRLFARPSIRLSVRLKIFAAKIQTKYEKGTNRPIINLL